jgi:hypothetical protein
MMMDLQHSAAGHFFVTVDIKGQKLKDVEFLFSFVFPALTLVQ